MKKMKLAVLLTAFMAMVGLSSCMGESDPYTTAMEIMKVDGYMGFYSFRSAGGYTVNPTNAADLTASLESGKYAHVTYKFDTRTVTQGTKKLDAEILGLMPIDDMEPANGNTEPNAPIMGMVNSDGSLWYSDKAMFFDKTNIFINVGYFYRYSSKPEERQAELDKHAFYLYTLTSEEDKDVNEKTTVLRLVHIVKDPENNKERTATGYETHHVNLSQYISDEPDKIIIKFDQSSSSSMDNASDNKVEINYKSIINNYFSNSSAM